MLVETVPSGTELGSADLPDTQPTWLELVEGAETSIDLGFFYAVEKEGSKLEEVWQAVERAGERGIRVRFLTDTVFEKTYPESIARLVDAPTVEYRAYDMREDTDGVMHAKYFVVDGRHSYVGSANFDWRSLEHIVELGVRLDSPELGRVFAWIFEHDWALAGGETPPEWDAKSAPEFPVELSFLGEPTRVWPAVSPPTRLGDPDWFDLPRLLAWIDTAESRVWLQAMRYRTIGYDKAYWHELESALRRAAARGVDVRLQVADWCKERGYVEGLKSLAVLPNVDVHFVTVPEDPEGFISFARVIHSKFLVVDDRRAWVGSSNASRSYFYKGRNVGVFLEGRRVNARLSRLYGDLWRSELSSAVDPAADYEPPTYRD